MNETPSTKISQSKNFLGFLASSRITLIFAILLAAILSALSPGNFWLGWLAYGILLIPGGVALQAAWRWAGGGRPLAWMLILALLLRIAAGLAFTLLLPVVSYDNPTRNGGYFFLDAFHRDIQAWDLAQSSAPISQAFNKSYSTDQYGGLLAFSGLLYRYLSLDAHRQMLPVVLGALVFAIGVAFLFKAAKLSFGEKTSFITGWIFALYPESVLLGSSQMREPFLMAFVAMAFYGAVARSDSRPRALPWLVVSLAGLLLVSPGIALVVLVVLAGWFYFSSDKRRVSWPVILAIALVFMVALSLFAWGASRGASSDGSPFSAALNWFSDAVKWDVYLLDRSSGWVQKLFNEMPAALHLPFVAVYGMLQPVLPAALIEPSIPFSKIIGILRATGWYVLLPLLGYGLFAAGRKPDKRQRNLLLWLGTVSWFWIMVAALRAGGDLWDNPRYRVIFLAFQAILAAFALNDWLVQRNPWLSRLLAIEAIFLLIFTHWYTARYFHWPGQMSFPVMAVVIFGLSGLVIGIGLWRDHSPKVHE